MKACSFSAAFLGAALLASSVSAQCVPPAGDYAMWIDPPLSTVIACPGQSVTFEVLVDAGDLDVSGFGFNLNIGAPGKVTSVVPGFVAAGGGFISHVSEDGQSVAALGFRSTAGPAVQVAARITFVPDAIPFPDTFAVSFDSDLALPNGIGQLFPILLI